MQAFDTTRINPPYSRRKEGGNDGDDSTMFESGGDVGPWWMVDLQSINLVHTVEILSRQNCCPERFHDVEVCRNCV